MVPGGGFEGSGGTGRWFRSFERYLAVVLNAQAVPGDGFEASGNQAVVFRAQAIGISKYYPYGSGGTMSAVLSDFFRFFRLFTSFLSFFRSKIFQDYC